VEVCETPHQCICLRLWSSASGCGVLHKPHGFEAVLCEVYACLAADHEYKGQFHARKLPFAILHGQRGLRDGLLGIGLLGGPLRRAVKGSGFPVSGSIPKTLVYPIMWYILVPSPDSWYIVSICLSLLVNSTGYCVDHYLSIPTP
jgi:hypothetical protein